MKLKKILVFEILSFVAVLLMIMATLKLIPSLQPSQQNTSIELYSARSLPKHTITLASGGSATLPFIYSSYDPAIIILELSFQTCEEPGYLTLYCNYRRIASIFVNPETPPLFFNLISVSGSDWVEISTGMFGLNELLFMSESQNGYAGTLTYQITLRGSR